MEEIAILLISMVYKLLIMLFVLFELSSQTVTANTQPILADTKIEYTISTITPVIYTKLTSDEQKIIASEWHLSVDDYTYYLYLMSDTVNSVYYKDKNLDPSWILGFNAKDEKERQKYVAIAIQNERLRVAKELAFQQEFDHLQRQLYPDLAPVLWNPKDE